MKLYQMLIKTKLLACIILFAIVIQGTLFVRAQGTTSGTDFWLTFGKNRYTTFELQIRIVTGAQPTSGTIYFTRLKTTVVFNIGAQQVYTYSLNDTEKQAVISTIQETSDRSIHIVANHPVTVYALNQARYSTDATNLLPITALGTDYFHISYFPYAGALDAYSIVATKDDTQLYHNDAFVTTIDSGQVYHRTFTGDMTGAHITTDKPVAFFALSQGVEIPKTYGSVDCLMQQLAPVNTWGYEFFVPVSHLARDIVRIVASQDNTTITQTGGMLLHPDGGQTDLNNLHTGQFVELEVSLSNNGCYIQADKPVGVCTYLTGRIYNPPNVVSDPSQAWLPSLEQSVTKALIAPVIPTEVTEINAHYALIIAPTDFKKQTTVSIGGAPEITLNDNNWVDHTEAQFSFYNMPLTNLSASYSFANTKGIIVMGYGIGEAESYYYLAYSGMGNLQTDFYVNNIHYQDLQTSAVCEGEVAFRARILGMNGAPERLEWYIDNVEEINARDSLEWKKYFAAGEYNIKMKVCFSEEDSVILETPLYVGYDINATASPIEGGKIDGAGCHKVNENAVLTAIPNFGYKFLKWTDDGNDISTEKTISFVVTEPRDLVAHFELKTYDVILAAIPPEGGTVSDDQFGITHGTSVTVEAMSNNTYKFLNWTENDSIVSTNATYTFNIMADRNLIANFTLITYDIILSASPKEGGTISGGGENISHGTILTVSATAIAPYSFINWTEDGIEVSKNTSFTFTVTESRTLIAHFEKTYYTINIEINEPDYGYITGAGDYVAGTTAQVEAIANPCYRFKNWTIDSVVVSTENPFIFTVTDHTTIVANFYALDFDDYTPILWDNTLLLNLKKLKEEGYEVTGCRWFKNDIELKETHTMNEFSYSAGPNAGDLLELSPTYYMFQIITDNFGPLCSTKKSITEYRFEHNADKLIVYPNPVSSGAEFSIVGIKENSRINVYNFMGMCVESATVSGSDEKFTLNLPTGIYLIRADGRKGKIMIIE